MALPTRSSQWHRQAWFIGFTVGFGWILTFPALFWPGESGGLGDVLIYWTPFFAALMVVDRAKGGPSIPRRLKVQVGRSWTRLALFTAIALILGLLVTGLSLMSSWTLGAYEFDLTNWAGLRSFLKSQKFALDLTGIPAPIVLAAILMGLALATVLTLPMALMLEIGFRSYLYSQLATDGRWRAIGLVGLVEGLWYVPILLATKPFQAVSPYVALGSSIVVALIVGAASVWLLEHTDSIWPSAAFRCAILSTLTPLSSSLSATSEIDTATATLTGWTGWWLPVIVVAILWLAAKPSVAVKSPTSEERHVGT